MTPEHAAAHHYATTHRWRVMPIIPGEKRPSIDAWQKNATTDPDLINQWWGRWPQHGVGIATGTGSGLFVLDVDTSRGKHGDDTLADLEHQHGPLPHTIEVITGSLGRHIYFRTPPGITIRNDQAGRLGPGLDIRGEGGQVVAPPTKHPCGRRYEWETSSHPDHTPLADPPDWLIELLTSQPDPALARRTPHPRDPNRTLPGDRYAATITWPELLEADGAHYLGTRRDHHTGHDYELWARPGVDHTSATLYYGGSDVLKVFTPEWGGIDETTGAVWRLEQDRTYTRFGYYAARHHGGDLKAAARAISNRDEHDWLTELATSHTHPHPAVSTSSSGSASSGAGGDEAGVEDDPPDEWEPPQPLTRTNPAPYPTHILPPWIRDACHDQAAAIPTPIDLAAQVALGVWSAWCATRVNVQIRPGHIEPVCTYTCTALHSGSGKSPVVNALTAPLHAIQDQLVTETAAQIANITAQRKILEREKAAAEKNGDRERISDLILQLDLLPVPARPRLVADDSTPEKLTELLAEQDGKFAVISSEGGVFDIAGGMYRSTSKSRTNLDVYLKGWSGDRIIRDRVGSTDRPGAQIVIPRAVLTVAVTVQPSVIAELRKQPELAGRGFTARFMYSVPTDQLGYRDFRDAQTIDPRPALHRYHQTFLRYADTMRGWQDVLISFSPDAHHLYLDWIQQLEPRLRPGHDLERLGEWVQKLRATVARVAALLHLAWGHQPSQTVTVETVGYAIELGEYWLDHARIVADWWVMDDTRATAGKVLERLAARGEPVVTERDLWVANRTAAHATVEDFRPVIVLLEEYGWLRRRPQPAEKSPGRPSTRFDIHPHVLAGASAQGIFARSTPRAAGQEPGFARFARGFPPRAGEEDPVFARFARGSLKRWSSILPPSRPEPSPDENHAQNAQNSGASIWQEEAGSEGRSALLDPEPD